MRFFNNLSIRDRFLVAPLFGCALTLGLYLIVNSAIQSKVDVLKELSNSNLPQVSELSVVGIAMLKIHSQLSHLLLMSVDDPDEERFYLGGREIISELFILEKKIYVLLENYRLLHTESTQSINQMKDVFLNYKEIIVGAIEIATVNPHLSREELVKANKLLNQNYDLLTVLTDFYIENLTHKSSQIDKSLADDSTIGIITISTLILMLSIALYFAKRMSVSIETVNRALVRLSQGDTVFELIQSDDQYLNDSFKAVAVFRDSLEKNEQQNLELNQAVIALNDSKEQYMGLLNTTTAPILAIDIEGKILLVNQAAITLFEFGNDDMVDRSFFDLVEQNLYFNSDIIKALSQNSEQSVYTFDKEPIIGIKASCEPFYMNLCVGKQMRAKTPHLIFSVIDVTQRILSEEKLLRYQNQLEERVRNRTHELQDSLDELTETQGQLIEAEKMAALGGLVAGVAHEINTPVGIGITCTSQLGELNDAFEEQYRTGKLSKLAIEKYIQKVRDCVKINLLNLTRGAELINSFKEISVDQSTEEVRSFDLKQYVEGILLSVNVKFKKTQHQINLHCDHPIIVYSVPGVYSQILTNFLMNSLIHGFEDEAYGVIDIEIKQLSKSIVLTYIDNGCGISKEQLLKIYDPFYTTKRHSGSTGLGMNIVYNLVSQRLAGTINCSSEPNKGVKFVLTLPINIPPKK
jgi:PAS domain S-box-containing protein